MAQLQLSLLRSSHTRSLLFIIMGLIQSHHYLSLSLCSLHSNTSFECTFGVGYCPTPIPSSTPSTSPSPSESPSSSTSQSVTRPFYPDWLSGDMTCKNDGEAPQYMVNNAAVWMFDDINTCCKCSYLLLLELFETTRLTFILSSYYRRKIL